MSLLKLLLSFAPWIAFMFISGPGMFRLKLGIVVAALLVIIMAVTKLHRGVILWAGVIFFSYAIIAVVLFNDMWAVNNMGMLSHGALALGTWFSVAIGRPFTMDYAKQHTDPALWNNPVFLRTNYIITSAWGIVFTAGVLLAWLRTFIHNIPHWQWETLQYTLMLITMLFTNWYPAYIRKRRAEQSCACKIDQ